MDSKLLFQARIFLFLLLVSVTVFSHANGLEVDMERIGMDYRRIELPDANPVLCQSACLNDAECKSFTYVKPDPVGASAICHLKKGQPSPTHDTCCVSGLRPSVTEETARSHLYQAHQEWLTLSRLRIAIDGRTDSLAEYAQKCEAATGINVPAFTCDAGIKVPGQEIDDQGKCNTPNVLNSACDPNSKFQVLKETSDAVVVAHCRKQGNSDGFFGDIAIIQSNKKNGATCFYQALGLLPGNNVPAPIAGHDAPWSDGTSHWISPKNTEAIGCTGCHDNGAFIRSPYLAQLKNPPHKLPSIGSGYDNLTTPLKYVGLDYASNRSWHILTSLAPGDSGASCTACHRLAVNNHSRVVDGIKLGTALRFAKIATASSQVSKKDHSNSSPIWMRPGQVTYDAKAEESAKRYHDCAIGFKDSGYVTAPPGCTITPLAGPWEDVEPPVKKGHSLEPIFYLLLQDKSSDVNVRTPPISFIYLL